MKIGVALAVGEPFWEFVERGGTYAAPLAPLYVQRWTKPAAVDTAEPRLGQSLVDTYPLDRCPRTRQPYTDLGPDYFDSQDTERIARHHIQRLSQLGYEVTVTPKEAA